MSSTLSDTDQLVGKTIGSYRIVKCLGKGGMGAVYFGEHPKIESKVAIKVLLPRFVSAQDIVRRFFDEARAVNRIGHPGIVRIHDCNKQEDVGVYLVMELLEGESLAERFGRVGRLGWEEVARLVQQCASALHASHKTGIIHRDLKPANIFVVPDPDMPGGERIKILDFGIAKLLEDNDPMDGSGTRTGMVIGSPMYMSPEQCIDSKSVDRRTDIYSLGAIAYRLMAGEFPYEADTLGRLILKQQKEKPAPLRSLGVEVPAGVAEVIHKALETEREDRYADMAEFQGALREAAEAAEDEPAGQTRCTQERDAPAEPEQEPEPEGEGGAEVTGPDIALDETAVAGAEDIAEEDPPAASREERQSTTLSGTVGERTAPPVSEPGRGRGAIIAGGIALVICVIVALVLWSRSGQQVSPPDDPGRRTAALGGQPPPRAAAPPASNEPDPGEVAAAPPPGPRQPGSTSPTPQPRDEMSDEAPAVKITLELSPADARVTLDGEAVSANPLSILPDGKVHKIKVSAAGHWPLERKVTADVSKTLKIHLVKRGAKKPHGAAATAPGKPKKPKPKPKLKLKKKKRIYFRNL